MKNKEIILVIIQNNYKKVGILCPYFLQMNKFSQWVITICVIIMTIFIILSYNRINTIVKMDYTDGYGNRDVLNNIDRNVIRISDAIRDVYNMPHL